MTAKKSELGKYWQQRHSNESLAGQVRTELEVSDLQARMIASRTDDIFAAKDYFDPKIKNLLPDPFHLRDMGKAVDRMLEAIDNKEKICIFADYDVDGATSSALIKNVLRELGIDSEIYVPDRIAEGYGPNPEAMRKIAAAGTKLVITVDCGSVAFEAIDAATETGLETIVIDHHISMDKLPSAIAVVNPNRIDENSDCKHLAAVGVSFLFMVGLLQRLRSKGFFASNKKREPNLINQLDIVALGTVCDVMSLTGLNRAFVKQGIKIARNRKNIGYSALCDVANLEEAINSYHLGFVIGPRINAGGRVGKASHGATLLSTTSMPDAVRIAGELDVHNNDRKVIELQISEEAGNQAKNQVDNAMIFVTGQGWHPGVIGIVAGRLKEKYNRPVAVIATNDGVGKASCRSVKGADFGSALLEAKNQGLLIAGGGHAMAAGFTVSEHKIAELQKFLQERFANDLAGSDDRFIEYYDQALSAKAPNIELFTELETLEPYGVGNPTPIFKFEKLFVLKADIVGVKHIKVLFAANRASIVKAPLQAISFNAVDTPIYDVLMSKKPLDLTVYGTLKLNKWNGSQNIQLHIKDITIE